MSRWLRLAFLFLGSTVLVVFVATTDLGELERAVAFADRRSLMLVVALLAANVVVKAMRWQVMVGQLSKRHLKLPAAILAILAGVAAGSLTPARSMEFAKPLLLRATHGVALASSTAAVLVERLLDGASLLVLFGGSLMLLPVARGSQFHPVLLAVGVFCAGVAFLLAAPDRLAALIKGGAVHLPLPQRVQTRLVRVVDLFFQSVMIWRRSRQLWPLLALSVIAAMLEAMRLTVVFAALGIRIAVVEAMLTFSVANLVAIISLIPGGIGITELSMAGMAGLVMGERKARAVVTGAVLVDRLLSYYLIVVLGGLLLLLAARGVRGTARE